MRRDRPDFATRGVVLVVAVLGVCLLALATRYGPHRDEVYFVSAGRRLDWGYPDQPSLTPLVARLADVVDPHDLLVLRLPSLVAVCTLVWLSAAFARVLGGARPAQLLTAVTIAASAFTVAVGHRLSTATFDTLAWTAILLVVARALVEDRPRLWLVAGLLAGIGLNNKHAVVFLLLGIVLGVGLTGQTRARLRTPWPWLGGLIALLLWIPNLVWQARHDWPVLTLSNDIADEHGGIGGRVGLVLQALVMFSPLVGVLFVLGLVQLLRRPDWVLVRPVAIAFVTVVAVFLVTGGKGYYVAGCVPALVAAAWTTLAERWPPHRLLGTGVVVALSGLVAWPAVAPVLPASTYAASFYPALDADQLETIGWPELVAEVRSTVGALPAEQRRTAVVLTANYGEAGALEWYGLGLPVYSGHNGWAEWGPPASGAGPVVLVGPTDPSVDFEGCRAGPVVRNDAGAQNEEQGRRIWTCTRPRTSWELLWPDLVHLDP